ncbi:MAG: GtrA-like protein [Bacteroidota bacterium]
MKSFNIIKHPLVKELLKYGLAGVFNTLLGLVLIYIQVELLLIDMYIALVLNYAIGFFTNFYLNRKFTFKSNGSAKKEMKVSVMVYVFSFLMQFTFVYILKEKQYWILEGLSNLTYQLTPDFVIQFISEVRFKRMTDPKLIAICFGIVVFAVLNFSLNKMFSFNQKRFVKKA